MYMYIAPFNGLQDAVAPYAIVQTMNTGAKPLLFKKSAPGSFTCVTKHRTNRSTSHPKDEASRLIVLLKN